MNNKYINKYINNKYINKYKYYFILYLLFSYYFRSARQLRKNNKRPAPV